MPEMNCGENGRRFDSCWELFTRNTEPVSEMSISMALSSNPCVSHVFDFNLIQGFMWASVRHLLASSEGECGKERIQTFRYWKHFRDMSGTHLKTFSADIECI